LRGRTFSDQRTDWEAAAIHICVDIFDQNGLIDTNDLTRGKQLNLNEKRRKQKKLFENDVKS